MTKIFLNYRRADSLPTAGRLHDSLANVFGPQNVFMDVDSIPAGVDFVQHLERHVTACDVLLALVGASWLDARNAHGQPRLEDEHDYVATEIAAALARDIPVIPVLIDGAPMPIEVRLPSSLKTLARRNAFQLRNEQFRSDLNRLVEKIIEVTHSANVDSRVEVDLSTNSIARRIVAPIGYMLGGSMLALVTLTLFTALHYTMSGKSIAESEFGAFVLNCVALIVGAMVGLAWGTRRRKAIKADSRFRQHH